MVKEKRMMKEAKKARKSARIARTKNMAAKGTVGKAEGKARLKISKKLGI